MKHVNPVNPEFLKTHEIVRAGAGAGKTYTLTHKVMDIADEHLRQTGRLPRLVVTTFTRKATQELRERLMVLALDEKPHLVDFVNSRSQLVVSTIHGVMDLYLKRYGANANIDPGYKVVGGSEASKLSRKVLRQVVLGDPEGSELLETFPFNRLCLLVRRLDAVLAENPEAKPYSLEDFEALFSQRALEIARDLDVVATKIKEESVKADWLEMAEVYTALAKILKRGDWTKNRVPFLAALESLKTARRNAKSPPVTDATADEAAAVREKAKELREPLFDPEVWRLFVTRFETLERIGRAFAEAFRKEKREQGFLEISDLELLAMDCIRQHPQTADSFCQEWDHWLIDEYQDTSPFQVELLRRLSGDRPNFIVGDPQQSIYLFRGARSEVFGEKESEILGGGGARRLLAVNRRSRPELLLFLNDFFSRLDPPFQAMEPFLKEGQSVDPSRLVATVFIGGAEATDAAEEAESAEGSDKEKSDDDADGGESQPAEEKSAREMRAIVEHVQKLLDSGAKPEDICVLARTNRTLADVASWLNRYRLPTHVHAAAGFFDRREIRDALSLLKFLVNPHDNFNCIELLRTPYFRVPDRTLVELTLEKPGSIWDRLVEERSMADEFKAVSRLSRLLESTMVEGLAGAFRRGLIDSGYFDLAHVHDVSGRRESNLWKLLARLQQEEAQAGFNPLSFIAGSVSDLRIEDGNAEGDAVAAVEPDRINLMTIHASKGLEFKHVILPRMEQKPKLTTSEEFTYDEQRQRWALRVPYGEDAEMTGSLPEVVWLERFQKQELEEHARVLYVALTRAVESVFLSWTPSVQRHSWAEMSRLDLSRGLHSCESYSYQVLDADPAPREAAIEQETEVVPRPRWKSEPLEITGALGVPKDAKSAVAFSVTQMLDRKPGVHFVATSQPDVSRRLKVAAEGTAVHRLMELLKYPLSREHIERLVQKWFPQQEEKVFEGIEFVQACTKPPLSEIIKNGEVEWGFSMIEDGLLIEGQVDLWGRSDDGAAWIIDYKTGNPESREKAFEQMSLYALALRKSGLVRPDEPLQLAAVYPFSRLIFIEDEPSREEVRARFGFPHGS